MAELKAARRPQRTEFHPAHAVRIVSEYEDERPHPHFTQQGPE